MTILVPVIQAAPCLLLATQAPSTEHPSPSGDACKIALKMLPSHVNLPKLDHLSKAARLLLEQLHLLLKAKRSIVLVNMSEAVRRREKMSADLRRCERAPMRVRRTTRIVAGPAVLQEPAAWCEARRLPRQRQAKAARGKPPRNTQL